MSRSHTERSREETSAAPTPGGRFSLSGWLGIAAVYVAVALLIFSPSLRSFFHSDDFVLIEQVRQGGPFSLWSHAPSGFLRPVISLTLFADLRMHGLNPLGYHLFNVLVHVANCLLVTALALRLFRQPRSRSLSLGAGFLFLLQPFHAESVCWISGRTDLVATFFFLATLLAYQNYRATRMPVALSTALLLYLPALFSKESVAILPLIVLLWECLLPEGDIRVRRRFPVLAIAAFFALTLGFVFLRRILLGALIAGYGTNIYLNFGWRHLSESVLWFLAAVQLPIFGRELAYLAVFVLEVALVLWRWRVVDRGQELPRIAVVLCLTCALSTLPVFTLSAGVADAIGGRLAYLPSVFGLMALVVLTDYVCGKQVIISRAFLFLLMILFSYQIHGLNNRWLAAGAMAHDVIYANLRQTTVKNRVVLVVPDCLYPAYVLRNGLPEGLRLFGGDRGGENVTVASSAFLFSREDTVEVRQRSPQQFTIAMHYRHSPAPNEAAISALLNDTPAITGRLLGPGSWEVTLPAGTTRGPSSNPSIESYTGGGKMQFVEFR